jgi:translation initiation factor IF-2
MREEEIGAITHYYQKLSVGIITLTDTLKVGDTIHIKGMHDDFTQKIDSMQIEHDTVTEASQGEQVGIKVTNRVHEHDKVFKVIE